MAVGKAAQSKPDPCSFVIFGVTGDLAHRLVVPALYNLAANDLLPRAAGRGPHFFTLQNVTRGSCDARRHAATAARGSGAIQAGPDR